MKHAVAALVLTVVAFSANALPLYAEIGTDRIGAQIGPVTIGKHATGRNYLGLRVHSKAWQGLAIGAKVEHRERWYYETPQDAMKIEVAGHVNNFRLLLGAGTTEAQASVSYKF